MTLLTRSLLQLLCLGAVALAIPLSLLQDMKELRLRAPPRSNKVKRAQEVIMFGNQQNRGSDSKGSNLQRTEKRAASESEEKTTGAGFLGDSSVYDTDIGQEPSEYQYQFQYQYGPAQDSLYDPKARNPAYRQQFYAEPAFSELGMYNMVDARRKREAKRWQHSYKNNFRNKRELDFNPDDLLPLIKLWEAEQRNKMRDSRIGWPNYGSDNEDYEGMDNREDNEIEPDAEYMQSGHWGEWPLTMPVEHYANNGQFLLPHQHKRFMVTKRRMSDDGYQDNTGGRTLYRRYAI